MSLLMSLMYVANVVVYDLYVTACFCMLVSISWWDYGVGIACGQRPTGQLHRVLSCQRTGSRLRNKYWSEVV